VTEQRIAPDFERRLQDALRSYSTEGVRAFNPALISERARSAGVGPLGRAWPRGLLRRVDPRVLRVALLVALLAVALVIALAGSRRTVPSLPVPGLVAIGTTGQILVGDPLSGRFQAFPAGAHDTTPVWSPDGKRIAFSQIGGRDPIQVVDADGRNLHAVIDGMGAGEPPAWSPDGARIAFAGYRYPGGAEPGLWVVGADGTGPTRLVASDAHPNRLAWSPDGSMIAFAQFDGEHSYVHVVDVASGAVTLVSSPLVDHLEEMAPLAWQPGKVALLYARAAENLGHDLVIAERIDGTWVERPLISDLLAGAAEPMWLDGQRFVFLRSSLGPGTSSLERRPVVGRADGTIERVLGDAPIEPVALGCVAPDGSGAAFPVGTNGTPDAIDLLMLPTDGRPATRYPAGAWVSGGVACSWQAVGP